MTANVTANVTDTLAELEAAYDAACTTLAAADHAYDAARRGGGDWRPALAASNAACARRGAASRAADAERRRIGVGEWEAPPAGGWAPPEEGSIQAAFNAHWALKEFMR